jgi:Domain of unknown function (DUF4145)
MLYELEIGREYCNCGNLMKCETTFRHRVTYEESPAYSIEIFDIYTCPACGEATLICYSATGNEDDDETNQDNQEWELGRQYNRTVLHAPVKQLHPAIPLTIAEVINQAQSVLFKSPRASFILCRAVLEEICNDFEIPDSAISIKGKEHFVNLQNRLSQLFKKEKMSDDLIAVVQGIRELGNEGAHSSHLIFSKKIKPQDARNLLDLVNYAVERLYVDKYRQEEAIERLSQLREKILPSDV